MTKSSKMTIILASCDAYKDVADQYVYFLRENWPDCPFSILVATESCDYNDSEIVAIKSGSKSTWTSRVIKAINACSTPYVLLTVDDLFMSEPVQTEDIDDILNYMESVDVRYYRIPVIDPVRQKFGKIPERRYTRQIYDNQVYSVSIGHAIWNRNELLKLMGDGTKSAWDLENDFSAVDQNKEPSVKEGYVTDTRHLLHSVHMIKKGKYIPAGVKTMSKCGYEIDTSKRGLITFKERIRPKIYGLGSKLCPPRYRRKVKSFLSKLGLSFATRN